MANQPIIIEASVDIPAPLDTVWRLITNSRVAARATGRTLRIDVTEKAGRGSGIFSIGALVFFIRYSPYDLELSSKDTKLKLRAGETPGGSRIMMAGAVAPEHLASVNAPRLQDILGRFRDIALQYTEADMPELFAEPAPADREVHRKLEVSPEFFGPDSNPRRPSPAAISGSGDFWRAEESVSAPKKKRRRKPTAKQRRSRVLFFGILLVILALLALVIFGAFRLFSGMGESTDRSARVGFAGAEAVEAGMTKNQVSFLLGTNGVAEGGDHVIYRSETALPDGRPREYISVRYAGGRVREVSYLNLTAALDVLDIGTFGAVIDPAMTAAEVAAAAEMPFSLWRNYKAANGEEIEEVHFGYLDPTINFDPAWRGEFAVHLNRTAGTAEIKNWGSYDGSDPSMRGSIEGTPYAAQYDGYTDFLNDRFQFNRSLQLLNRYSLGDTKYFFDNEPVHYSDDFGYSFYSVDSAEKLPDSALPLYRISIGYDYRGGFRMASFSNMRLYNKAGTLRDTGHRTLTRGMSYSEVRQRMMLIPTAIYIEANSYSVCYGRFLDTEVLDEQFELIVRFNIETGLAEQVLDNTAVSEVRQ